MDPTHDHMSHQVLCTTVSSASWIMPAKDYVLTISINKFSQNFQPYDLETFLGFNHFSVDSFKQIWNFVECPEHT